MTAGPAIDRRAVFAQHSLFRTLRPEEIDKLVQYSRVERHAANATIFMKGSPGQGMMAVLAGRVKISAPSADGKEVVLNVIYPGQVFGEIALLDGKDRTADAIAATDCELLVLERRDFLPLLEKHPEMCIRLMTMLCERLRNTSEQIEDLLFLDLPSRLAKTLLRLADTHGQKRADGIRIGFALSQRELGNMVGTTRESINKLLGQWQRTGSIAIDQGVITLKNRSELERLAEGPMA